MLGVALTRRKMKLLNVELVLERDKDFHRAEHKTEVLQETDDKFDEGYAIVSHRWGPDGTEVSYEQMTGLMKMEEQEREQVRQRDGYHKIIRSCEQAREDGYQWLWIDTCCIDKRSSTELSEAINSMYRWYQDAGVCYAYLNDVDEPAMPTKQNDSKFAQSNGWPEWFSRGWTLQELIAPKQVKFFNKDWVYIGNKRDLGFILHGITRIPRVVLRDGLAAKRLSVAQIMSWAADRETKRVEDRAYSLMGLFGVNMPMLYGEGGKAFQRLQLEIIRVSDDHSLFAWDPLVPRTGSVLAENPDDFRDCGHIEKVEPDKFGDALVEYIEWKTLGNPWYIRHNFRKISTNPAYRFRLARLRRLVRAFHQPFRAFTVSYAGIEVCLPVIPIPGSPPHLRVILACTDGLLLITIDLVLSGSGYNRAPRRYDAVIKTFPVFKTLHLDHHQDVNSNRREFTLDDKHASYHNFTRRATHPPKFTGDTVALSSLIEDLVVVVYANNDTGSCFAVGLGYYLSSGWVHVICDEPFPTQEAGWADFAESTHRRMWIAQAEHAQNMDKQRNPYATESDYFIKHAHLPQSTFAARVVWGRWEMDNFKVMVDVEQCPGCCVGPHEITRTSIVNFSGPDTPGLMGVVHVHVEEYFLELDGWQTRFLECSGQQFKLGDYGDYSNGKLARIGNIFDDMRVAGVDVEEPTYCAVTSCTPGFAKKIDWMKNRDDLVVAYPILKEENLVLHQPRGVFLPANEHFLLLLKDLSIHLAEKLLVIATVQCSDFYEVDEDGKRKDSGDALAPDRVNQSPEAVTSTPLCIIATPQVWKRTKPCGSRRGEFKRIREHFFSLVNMREHTRIKPCYKFVKKHQAIKFFSNIFGLKYLTNYIGKITFFTRFPSEMGTGPRSDVLHTGATEEDVLRVPPPKLSYTDSLMRHNLLKGGQQSTATKLDPRLEVALPLWRRRCKSFTERFDARHRYADERQRVEGEMKSIWRTLGADLLKHIMTTLYDTCREHDSSEATRPISSMEYNREPDSPSMIQHIKELQVKLNATKDEDEQRALEEDVTGKILWLFWCGICAEVDQLLPKVTDFIREEGNLEVGGITWVNIIMIAIHRVYDIFIGLFHQQFEDHA
ncbi:heterokaryon incompatibility protein-domain-containing protein [Pisolithus albus]|nr:heterokaryon incompatibility protein-domain-containing protein [Pisolithus albus]